jgi:hypothetical protein
MKREDFEHVIRAVADTVDDEIIVIGSQAVLGSFPQAPPSLLTSQELDVYPRTRRERTDEIDRSHGDGSRFHETFGYYAQGVGPETATLPSGWEDRLIRVEVPAAVANRPPAVAWCLDVHDLVVAKLAAGRDHDIRFAEAAIREGLVQPALLAERAAQLPETKRRATEELLRGVQARVERS